MDTLSGNFEEFAESIDQGCPTDEVPWFNEKRRTEALLSRFGDQVASRNLEERNVRESVCDRVDQAF